MAFMGILAMWLGIIIIVLGTCIFFGCLFFIIALVMKLRAKRKPAVREDGTEYVKKWYWIPGTLSIISFVPVVLFIIFIAYAAIASSIENRQSLQYQVMNNNYKQAERLLKKGVSPDCTLESNEPAKDGEKTLLMIINGNKQDAAKALLLDDKIDPMCPATFLRLHRVSGIDIELCSADFTAAQFLDQVKGTFHRHYGRIFIDTLGEAHAGVGNLTQRLRTLTDVVMSELRCLEHDRRGGIQDLGIETAHDACQCDRLLPITDNKVFCGKSELFFIESYDLLALFRTADMDLAAFKIREIESMHRLAEFL